MERAVAAEERRAFLLPHCRYLCAQSCCIPLTLMHSSHALPDIVDALRAPQGTALFYPTHSLRRFVPVRWCTQGRRTTPPYSRSKHALAQYGLIVCPCKHPLSYSAHDGRFPGACQPKRHIASWTCSITGIAAQCVLAWAHCASTHCQLLICKDACKLVV